MNQSPPPPPTALDLVLIGGGHAHVHVHVLKMLGMMSDRECLVRAGVQITVISFVALMAHSVFGHFVRILYLAGHYTYDDIHLDINQPMSDLRYATIVYRLILGVPLP